MLDDNQRIVERQIIAKHSKDPTPRVYEKHVLSDYRSHSDTSGETIWFPHTADYHYYMGALPDGTLVEYYKKLIKIRDISFNVDIPDDKFVLEFPREARVYDGVSGAGWLDENARRASAIPPAVSPLWTNARLWLGVLLPAGLLGAIALYRWKRRHS